MMMKEPGFKAAWVILTRTRVLKRKQGSKDQALANESKATLTLGAKEAWHDIVSIKYLPQSSSGRECGAARYENATRRTPTEIHKVCLVPAKSISG